MCFSQRRVVAANWIKSEVLEHAWFKKKWGLTDWPKGAPEWVY